MPIFLIMASENPVVGMAMMQTLAASIVKKNTVWILTRPMTRYSYK
jgi:hypothetical protein